MLLIASCIAGHRQGGDCSQVEILRIHIDTVQEVIAHGLQQGPQPHSEVWLSQRQRLKHPCTHIYSHFSEKLRVQRPWGFLENGGQKAHGLLCILLFAVGYSWGMMTWASQVLFVTIHVSPEDLQQSS